MKIKGRVWKYGDDVNTDVIFPGKYNYAITDDLEQMGHHALEDLDDSFRREMQPGDMIVAGKNWGCGSSREQAVKCLKARGVGAIIAKSFSRIYFRNAINTGIHAIVCPEAVNSIQAGDTVEVDFEEGVIRTVDQEWPFTPLPAFLHEIMAHGGMIEHLKTQLQDDGSLEK